MNVTAGIGVLGQASPMIQEMFPGRVTPIAAASFVGLISLFNMVGRFFWASTSDYIGRRNTYMVFFVLGIVLYCLVPTFGHMGSMPLFVGAFCIILSMYGGGFATDPGLSARYLRHVSSRRHSWPAADGLVGRRRVGSACWSITFAPTRSTSACPRRRPTRSPCTSCAACC